MESALRDHLEYARRAGALGPGPVDAHLEHALGLARIWQQFAPPPALALDLGSGGGVPGLVLATAWPGSEWVLLDGSAFRGAVARSGIARLGLGSRVQVVVERAEIAAHDARWRERFALVVARGFGPPAATAEAAAGFVAVGGSLLVSEPPQSGDRWTGTGGSDLGFEAPEAEVDCADDGTDSEVHAVLLRKAGPAPREVPRTSVVRGGR